MNNLSSAENRRPGCRRSAPQALCVLLLASICGTSTSSATVMTRMTIDDLADRATCVVVGHVRKETSRRTDDGKYIVTDTTIDVSETIHGVSVKELTVRRLGGSVGGVGMRVAGTAALPIGSEVVLFAEKRRGHWIVVGMRQGAFNLVTEKNGTKRIGRNLSGIEFLSSPTVAIEDADRSDRLRQSISKIETPLNGVRLSQFITRIRKALLAKKDRGDANKAKKLTTPASNLPRTNSQDHR